MARPAPGRRAWSVFSFNSSADPRDLPSFPTRRSSDLPPPPSAYYASTFPTITISLARTATSEIALELRASSAEHPGGFAGYLLTPVGTFQHTETNGNWRLTLSAQGSLPGVAISASGVDLAPGAQASAGGEARVRLERQPTTPASTAPT